MKLKTILERIELNLLKEALPLSTAKEYTSIDKNPAIQKQIDDIFSKLMGYAKFQSKRGDRLYVQFDKVNKMPITTTYMNVRSNLQMHDYEISDYIKGIATDKYGREVKIGKILNKVAPHILQQFNNDSYRINKGVSQRFIVFSKHPYDIAGMTSGRKWADSSCMNLAKAYGLMYVSQDVSEGTIIAYLVDGKDMNLKNPLARLLIKPYTSVTDSNVVLYVPEGRIYGTATEDFRDKVVEMLDTIQGEKVGAFKIKNQLYCDSKRIITKIPKNVQNIFDGNAKPKTKEEVKQVLDNLEVENYTINDDLSVDVNTFVNLYARNLKVIPVKFGRVTGSFYCSDNDLTSLKGSPEKVDGGFYCNGNDLTSLEGAPKKVDGDFYCPDNDLTSLEGAPKKVDGDFYCPDNDLTSLEGAPEKVGGDFYCPDNDLTSLEGAPEKVGGHFYCSRNKLTSLKGSPEKVDGGFYCSDNDLTSLKGAPEKVGGHFHCSRNKLTSLKGSPEKVDGGFYCNGNDLTSLEGAPKKVDGDFYCPGDPKAFTEEDVRAVTDVIGGIYIN